MKSTLHSNYVGYGQTEVVDNNLNPKWVKHFILEYFADQTQCLLFEVWDEDDPDSELIGKAEVTMADIMQA